MKNDGELVCALCWPDLVVYGEVVPGYVLARQPSAAAAPGRSFPGGFYGLFVPSSHAPEFAWEVRPAGDDDDDRQLDAVEAMGPAFRCDPMAGYRLVKACVDAGYSGQNSGMPLYWLAGRMARLIDAAERASLDGLEPRP